MDIIELKNKLWENIKIVKIIYTYNEVQFIGCTDVLERIIGVNIYVVLNGIDMYLDLDTDREIDNDELRCRIINKLLGATE